MARMKPKSQNDFVLFNVHYEDGSQKSNRKVPTDVVQEHDPDRAIENFIQAQDDEIAEKSGKPRGPIKSIERVKTKKAKAA